jgi:hypothetical protein
MFPEKNQHRSPKNLYPSRLKNIHAENRKRLLQRCWFSRWLPDSCTSVNSSTGFKACFFPKLGDKNREQTGQQTNSGASNPIITILDLGTGKENRNMFPEKYQHRSPKNLYPSRLKNIHAENQKRLLQRCWFSRWLPDSCTSVNSSTGLKACFFPKLGDKKKESKQDNKQTVERPIL